MKIDGREISSNLPPYIIAEISANHNGDINRAFQTIKAAKASGASAVKIQTYTADTMTIDCELDDFKIQDGLWKGKNLYQLYSEACTPFEWHPALFKTAAELGITLFSSPFDESAVELLESLNAPAYKVASFELVDTPLIEAIAKTGKPILMSTGMASYEEIGEAIETARSHGGQQIALFHCISSYPAPLDQANLLAIKALQREFAVETGLSDHTLGNLAAIVATSLGASLIEKHFTVDRNAGGVDSTFSVEPDEMKSLVETTKQTFASLGDGSKKRPSVESASKIFRRSLYFISDIAEGEKITPAHVGRIRPGHGLPPKHYKAILGQPSKKSAKRGERVTIHHVDI